MVLSRHGRDGRLRCGRNGRGGKMVVRESLE